MYKGSIDIGWVNKSLRVSFNLVIMGNNDGYQRFNSKIINKFACNNSEYLKFTPRPYLTLDICKYENKQKIYDPACQINISKRNLFVLIQRVKKMIENFKIQDMFFIKNKQLRLNIDKAKSVSQVMRTNDKAIYMIHGVIPDDERPDVQYEGITLMINNAANYVLITYDELLYLYYILTNVNMDMLSMQLINSYLLLEKRKDVDTTDIIKTLSEVNNDNVSNSVLPKLQEPNVIPDI